MKLGPLGAAMLAAVLGFAFVCSTTTAAVGASAHALRCSIRLLRLHVEVARQQALLVERLRPAAREEEGREGHERTPEAGRRRSGGADRSAPGTARPLAPLDAARDIHVAPDLGRSRGRRRS